MNEEPIEDEAIEETEVDATEEPVSEPEAAAEGHRLVLKRAGAETDTVFAFTPPATVGRFDASVGPVDIDLGSIDESATVSRNHAQFVEEDGTLKVKDLGSSNGTYVLRDDFEKVEEAELSDGDELAFGNARFVYRA